MNMIQNTEKTRQSPLAKFWQDLQLRNSLLSGKQDSNKADNIHIVTDNAKTHIAPEYSSPHDSLVSWGSVHLRNSGHNNALINTPFTPQQWDRNRDSVVGFVDAKKNRWGSNSSPPLSNGSSSTQTTQTTSSSSSSRGTPYHSARRNTTADFFVDGGMTSMLLPFQEQESVTRSRRGSFESNGSSVSSETPLSIPRRRESVGGPSRSSSFDSQSSNSSLPLTIPSRRESVDVSPNSPEELHSSDSALVMPQRRISDHSTSSTVSNPSDHPLAPHVENPLVLPRRRDSDESASSFASTIVGSENCHRRSSMESIQEFHGDNDDDDDECHTKDTEDRNQSSISSLPYSRNSLLLPSRVGLLNYNAERTSMESIEEYVGDDDHDAHGRTKKNQEVKNGKSHLSIGRTPFTVSGNVDSTMAMPRRRSSSSTSSSSDECSEPQEMIADHCMDQGSQDTSDEGFPINSGKTGRGESTSMESIPEQSEANEAVSSGELVCTQSPRTKYSKSDDKYPLRKPPTRTDSRELALDRRYERRHAIMAQIQDACRDDEISQTKMDKSSSLKKSGPPSLIDAYAYDCRSSIGKRGRRNDIAEKYLQTLKSVTEKGASFVTLPDSKVKTLDSLAEEEFLENAAADFSYKDEIEPDHGVEYSSGEIEDSEKEGKCWEMEEEDQSPGSVRVFVSRNGFASLGDDSTNPTSALRSHV